MIDEEAAEVVRLIFRLFLDGKNRNQIAVYLKNEQIPTPTFYMKDGGGRGTCKNKTLNEENDTYFKYKGKKPLTESEQIQFTAAKDYLKGVMNGKTTIPTKAWKTEYAKLTAERKTLNQRYLELKEEVKEAEKIRKSVYSILRQEQREHAPRRTQDMNR